MHIGKTWLYGTRIRPSSPTIRYRPWAIAPVGGSAGRRQPDHINRRPPAEVAHQAGIVDSDDGIRRRVGLQPARHLQWLQENIIRV